MMNVDTKDPDNIDGKGRVFMCKSMVSLMRKQRARDMIKVMDGLGWTETQAMDFYEIPEEERPGYKALVKAERAKRANAATAPVPS